MLSQKWNIIVSIIVGLAVNFIVNFLTQSVVDTVVPNPSAISGESLNSWLYAGWPYRVGVQIVGGAGYDSSVLIIAWLINALVWIAIMFLALNLFRYFKIRKQKV